MMADRWLKHIHNSMADFETDAPNGLWDAIEHEIRQPERQTKTWRPYRFAATIAAMIVVSIGLLHYLTPQEPNVLYTLPAISKKPTENVFKADSPKPLRYATVTDRPIARRNGYGSRMTDVIDTMPAIIKETADISQSTDSDNIAYIAKRTADTISDPYRAYSRRKSNQIPKIMRNKDAVTRLTFSMYTSGSTNSSLCNQANGGIFMASAGADDSNWADSPLLGLMLYNQGHTINTEIHHRQPIRAGVSFTYNVNDRIGIESGIIYSNLQSDITEGTDKHYYHGIQKLHYIGIPLSIKYRAFSWRRFDLYASAGIAVEKCISSSFTDSYILDGESFMPTTKPLQDKPLQLSANISAGIQYNITNQIGLYAEPGISHYFDDGTSLQTIYKEKPFNFIANIGLRFTFNRN